jgi:hypothetical protein
MAIDLTDVPLPADNVDLGYRTDWRKILKLDCMDRPGLSEREFFGLFAKCNVCNLVMACQSFSLHYCALQTTEDDNSERELTDEEE